MSAHVIGIGVSYLDHLFVLPSLRCLAEHAYRVPEMRTEGGGLIATAMVAVARLGGEAELWSRIGDDFAGRAILEGLQSENVDVSNVQVVGKGLSPTSIIAVDGESGERRIFYFDGSGLDRAEVNRFDLDRIKRAGCVLVDASWPQVAMRALQMAREHGVPTCADVSQINEKTMPLVRMIDVLIVPEHCGREFAEGSDFKRAARAMKDLGPHTVIVTLGPRGCCVCHDKETYCQEAFRVDVADTTGAGDAFHGAYAYALARRWDVRKCVVFASAVAALKCRKLGGRAGLPSLSETVSFLERKGIRWNSQP